MLEEADMTASAYAPGQAQAFPSIYGQQGYGQQGYEQQGLSPFGMMPQLPGQQLFGQQPGLPQQLGQQQFGGQQFPFPQQQQFGGQGQFPQFGVSEQLAIVVQVLPQVLHAALQNLTAGLHLTHQIMQLVQMAGRQGGRPFGTAW